MIKIFVEQRNEIPKINPLEANGFIKPTSETKPSKINLTGILPKQA